MKHLILRVLATGTLFTTAALLFHSAVFAQNSNAASSRKNCLAIPVAIDVGHSMKRPGTRSARGVPEYMFNRRQAEAIAELARNKFSTIRAVIINRKGQNISLRERVARSVKAGARIYVSVHHDSAQKRYLRQWVYRGKNLDHTPSISGFSVFISPQERGGRSRRLADAVARNMVGLGRRPTGHHAENIPGERRLLLDRELGIYAAPFSVLVRSSIPAVLVEFGVIRNKREEAELSRPATRQKLANAVLQGIVQFCHNDPVGCGC